MRISTSQLYETHRRSIDQRLSEYVAAQKQVSTGKRIERPSDDPISAAFLLKSKSLKTAIEQYDRNLSNARDTLSNSEVAFEEVNNILNNAYTVALQGANGATDQAARDGIAHQVGIMQSRILELANTRGANQQYVFAGQKNDLKPFALGSGTLTYNGDSNPILVEISAGETLQANRDASQQFIKAYEALEGLKTNLIGGNTGAIAGISIDAIKSQREAFTAMRGDVGASLNKVTELENHNQRRMDELTSQISDVEDVDLAEAVSNMQRSQVAYQAALNASAQSFRLSLMDYLR